MNPSLALQGGSEGDLFKHCLLVDLLSAFCPSQGDFSYLESDTHDICHEAHPLSLHLARWLQKNQEAEDPTLPLFLQHQQAWLSSGLYMGSAGLALRTLWEKSQGRVAFRWLFEQSAVLDPVRWQAHLEAWARSVGLSWQASPHTLLQIRIPTYRTLHEVSSLGGLVAPGLAWLDPPHPLADLSDLLFLLTHLLQKNFFVLLRLPFASSHPNAPSSTFERLDRLSAHLLPLGMPGLRYRLDVASPFGRRPLHEVWLLGPDPSSFERLYLATQPKLQRLFCEILPQADPSLPSFSFDIRPLPSSSLRPPPSVRQSLPRSLAPGIEMDRACEADLEAILSLWEDLMDEHARLDEHFQRQPFARVYLRSQLLQQLSSPDFLLLVLRDSREKGGLLGFASAQILRSTLFQESRFGQIVDLYLRPSRRRQGFGRALVDHILLWCQAHSLRQIDLNVACLNPQAERFWQTQGFQPYLSVMSKDLSPP